MSRQQLLSRTRNMGIVAHVDAGKTTTTERILFYSGETHKIGDVDDGNTVTDHMDQEKERGITIVAAAVSFNWQSHFINLIDTPGHIDFNIEVERAMRVLDGVVVVICAKGGVETQTATVYGQAEKHSVPRIIFVNKMDTTGADFYKVLDEVDTELKAKYAALQIPIGESETFAGIIDLLSMKALFWDASDPNGSRFEQREIPAAYQDRAQEYRRKLVESVCDTDDALLDKYLNERPISVQELKDALRRATISMKLVPVLLGSAKIKRGVQPLLDAVTDFLPSPVDAPPVQGELKDGSTGERGCGDDEPLAALVFKVVSDKHGFLYYVRVYSGKLRAGETVFNSNRKQRERIGRLVKMQGCKREEVDELCAGDIGVCLALKHSSTGDTLCDEHKQIRLEKITSPEPVLSRAVEPMSKGDEQKLAGALARLAAEDPSFTFRMDPETGQLIVMGQGELHLEVMLERMKREDKVEVRIGKPMVSYRETVRRSAQAVGELRRQNGGRGMYGVAEIVIEPLEPGAGFEFVDDIVGGTIPREFIPCVEKGVKEALNVGPLTGSPVIDVRVRLVDGKYHDVDSNATAFEVAGAAAFRNAFDKALPVLLEPVMKLTVTVPDTYMGGIIGDLGRRRGRVQSTDLVNGKAIISARVPLAEAFGYTIVLRNATQGHGSVDMVFGNYEPVPAEMAATIVEDRRR